MAGEDRLRELEEKYEGYKVYDNNGESIGKVDDLFVDERDREEYIGVKMGLFGLSGTTLIPMEIVRVNDRDRVIEVAESKERVKDAPQYRDDDEIDRSFEERIRGHFGLGGGTGGSYDRPTDASGAEGAAAGDNTMRGDDYDTSDRGSRENVGREEYRNDENYVSDSAMASAAGGASTSGGVSDFETGDRGDGGEYREGGGEYRESGGQHREGSGQDDRQGAEAIAGETSGTGGQDTGESAAREAYLQGYRDAIRESSGGQGSGPSGSAGSGEGQGGRTGDREGASEYFGAPAAEPGEKEFTDMQDYQSASTGYQPGRDEGSGGGEGEGRTRIRRLRRGS
ncbi:PRC-barrel domain-containing protein [Rubrobacter marinus]|uniref:PRC-barrel domain-containing protein n=1 Tax=Rubrobacter marinus TaxID=2653852 RepID=UPI00140A4B2C|nr:PRC-barrel domain-containing protein [Rubrobacter marinus]